MAEPIVFRGHFRGYRYSGPGIETAASMDALLDCRDREHRAVANEHAARGDYLKTLDLLCLRNIAAIHQRVFPGPHADGLERV